MIAYLDASVILRVAFEQGEILAEWPQIERPIGSALVRVECLRALDRLRLQAPRDDVELSRRSAQLLRLLAPVALIAVDRDVLDRAAGPMPTELRTLDAIHLASALLWQEMTGERLVMATYDNALALAAQAHGMRVIGAHLA